MKYSFVLKYIIGGAVVAFLLQYLFNEKDITFWMIVCLTIAVMVAIHMLVRVFFYYQTLAVSFHFIEEIYSIKRGVNELKF